MTTKTITVPLEWTEPRYGMMRLWVGPIFAGSVYKTLSEWRADGDELANGEDSYHPSKAEAVSALERAVEVFLTGKPKP